MVTVPEASGTQAGTAFRAGERTRGNVNVLSPPPLACALGTNPASARPQSTAILAINEVNFVYVVLMLTSPTIMGLGTDRFEISHSTLRRLKALYISVIVYKYDVTLRRHDHS